MADLLPVDWDQPEACREALQKIQSVLSSGGVIAFPTDTFYGLGADPFNSEAVSKIFRIKQRPADKPLLVLIQLCSGCWHWLSAASSLDRPL